MPTNKHVANIKSNQMLEILLKAIDYKWIAIYGLQNSCVI